MKNLKGAPSLTHPAVAATVHSEASLTAALKVRKGECDWLELRVDNFFPRVAKLRRLAPTMALPRIVTVRHASEGGAPLPEPERRRMYGEFLPVAGLVDIELRRLAGMREVIREARAGGVGLVLSFHDFQRTPRLARLRELARRAADAGADVFKVAVMTNEARDLATLIEFLAAEKERLPISAMGMGPYGKVSRLALARAGSCLNYGYLGRANASGQWPVRVLKERIGEILGE
jgi:3-dehydroquinate dehydratase-1